MLSEAIKKTFEGWWKPTSLHGRRRRYQNSVWVEVTELGRFSGISANPAIGHTSIFCRPGGRTILSESPNFAGVEQE